MFRVSHCFTVEAVPLQNTKGFSYTEMFFVKKQLIMKFVYPILTSVLFSRETAMKRVRGCFASICSRLKNENNFTLASDSDQ